ncbi:unnamed protein product [Cercospora beticola]|nr:unnamed protein product [Cercospora beticola]
MGGWGLQLFCCDMDLDMIRKLTYDCGVNALEAEHGKTPSNACAHHWHAMRDADHNIMAHEGSPESRSIHVRPYSTDGEKNINFSLLASLCTHPDIVRQYLDNSGIFTAKMTSFRLEAMQSRPGVPGGTQDPWGPAYKLCLFGACGMTLGVKISDGERDSMRQYYKDCGLVRDAVTQLGAALDRDSGYVNGVPWDFGSVARNTIIANGGPSQEDLIFPGTGLLDTWAPDHGRYDDKMWDMRDAVVKAVAQGARPTVDEWTTTFASMFFCPLLEPRTKISSTKADARTNMWRYQAVRFAAFFAPKTHTTRPVARAVQGPRQMVRRCHLVASARSANTAPLLVRSRSGCFTSGFAC